MMTSNNALVPDPDKYDIVFNDGLALAEIKHVHVQLGWSAAKILPPRYADRLVGWYLHSACSRLPRCSAFTFFANSYTDMDSNT